MKANKNYLGSIACVLIGLLTSGFSFARQDKHPANEDYLLNHQSDRGELVIHVSDYKVKYSGYITLSDDDKDVLSISPGGFLEISKLVFGSNRTIRISSNDEGKLSKKFMDGRTEKDFSNEGKQWLADILPRVARSTGVGAEHRVARIFDKSGMSGLLEEIREIDDLNPAARNLYFVIMIDQLKLDENDLKMALPQMKMIMSNSTKGTLMREVLYRYNLSSETTHALLKTTSTLTYNTERGSTLRVYNKQFKEEDQISDVYFRIIEEMNINSEKANVLKDLIRGRQLKNSTYVRIFRNLESFRFTREKGAILLALIDNMPKNESLLNEFSSAVDRLDNHYYVLKGEIMNTLLEARLKEGKGNKTGGDPEIEMQMLNTAEQINSNSQKGLILRKVNGILSQTPEVLYAYREAIRSVDDNIEKYNVLLDLLNKNDLNKKAIEMVIDEANDLVSDDYQHAAGAVLRAVIPQLRNDESVLDDFFDCIGDMDQNSTLEELLRLVHKQDELSKNEFVILKTIEAAKKISVDIEVVSVLKGIRFYNPKSSAQSIAYRYVTDNIQSDYLKRKTLDRSN